MALIEYDIQYDDKNETSKVTCRVIGVGKGDRIRFKSNDSNTGIQYVGGSPFSDPAAPQPDKVFKVGKKTAEFEVPRPLTKTLHFKCGEVVSVPNRRAATVGSSGGADQDGQTLEMKLWKGGGATPGD